MSEDVPDEEIPDAIELTPKEHEYHDAKEAIEKQYEDMKVEIELAKREVVRMANTPGKESYTYNTIASLLHSGFEKSSAYHINQKISGDDLREIIDGIERQEKENEEYKAKAMKEILTKLTSKSQQSKQEK